jgi:hypothetical protein
MPRPLLSLLAALSLAGCATTAETPVPAPTEEEDACGASGLQDLVGEDVSVVAAMTFLAPMRIIRPGEAVTLDFNPARLNFELDAGDRIVRVYCG